MNNISVNYIHDACDLLQADVVSSWQLIEIRMMLEYIKDNLDDLREVGADNITIDDMPVECIDLTCGLCDNVFTPLDLDDDFKYLMFESWDGFTGSMEYPVEGSCIEYSHPDNIYKFDNPDRMELLDHCINFINEVI